MITADVPKWLWNGVRISKHPTMILHQPDLELSVANAHDAALGGTASVPSIKWETDADKAEAIMRQFEEASRTRTMNEAAEGLEDVDNAIDDPQQDIPIPRSLEALDLAGI